ncbi:13511_t:CDS:2 [Ambispora gerdemannii]|uniref:13511_t:CDS:1 n=1 Tax=Ambispora gerdemannii TaxID=144530 RepID=A0A9N9CG87_9GLOM|nr:13511_t:CDS:2 [Ambispora gerdemannii]
MTEQAHPKASSSTCSGIVTIFSEKKLRVLRALIGTFIAELEGSEQNILMKSDAKVVTSHAKHVEALGKYDLSNVEDFIDKFQDLLTKHVPDDKIQQIKFALKLLSNGVTAYPLTGYTKPFYELNRKQREAVLLKWSASSQGFQRKIFRSFYLLICFKFWSSPYDFYPAIGYPGPDPKAKGGRFTNKEFPKFEFLDPPTSKDMELTFDVIIVGSGAGGSVAAAELSKMGNSVLVIEKGKYYHQRDLTLEQADATEKLYENAGMVSSEDGSLYILAGSTFGGGTTVSWSASLRVKEWAREGLGYFLTEDYRRSLNVIIARMGVTDENIIHNVSNKTLMEGCKKLGIHVETVPQNSAARPHECGWCTFGCKYGEKQGSLMTFLKDAQDNGAKFLQDCFVEEVLVESGKATGVLARVGGDDHQFIIRANKVIVAGGAIHSPALLLRSGLKNKNIGKNLYTHPAVLLYGIFNKDVKAYNGTILTTISNVVENVDGDNYGAKIEVPALHPTTIPYAFPWKSSLQHKILMTQLNHMVALVVIARDKDSGRVVTDSNGRPRIHYTVSQHDGKSITAGLIAGLKILVAAGAKKVGTGQAGVDEFVTAKEDPLNDPKFLQYLKKVSKVGCIPNQAYLASAHQMGTCRMGVDSGTSVVDQNGECWETKNLYVADASLCPSAVGVNPMVTTMSFGYSVAKAIINKDNPKATTRTYTNQQQRRTMSMRITSKYFAF